MDIPEVGRSLSEDEERTHFGIWAITFSPSMIGCDLRTISEKTLSIITNQEVIALNQDSLGMQAEVIERGKDCLILSKAIQKRESKLHAVASYNRSNVIKKIRVDFDKLHLSGKVQVRDLWNHQETGTFTEYYETLAPTHGTALIRFKGSRHHDRICYEAEYVFMQEHLSDNKQMTYFAYKAGAPGDYMMKRLGNSSPNWAELRKIYVSKGGEYQLKITYFSGDKRDIQIAVNESEYK